MQNVFEQKVVAETIDRINLLNADTKAQWGTMDVSQMLAHCNVSYELVYEDKHAKPNAFLKFILTKLVKGKVVSEKGYPKNGKTAPQFVIKGEKDFTAEQKRLLDYIQKTKNLGERHFEGKESHSFGPLNSKEWSNMFYKHIDHHLKQFGV